LQIVHMHTLNLQNKFHQNPFTENLTIRTLVFHENYEKSHLHIAIFF
jgi:hypothetical protein